MRIFGQHDESTLRQIQTCVAAGGERGVLCADGHKGYAQPIGGVVAYKDKISLSGVGFDIACGNLAIRTDVTLPQIQWAIARIMDDVVHDISFGIGRKAKIRVDHELFDDSAWILQPMRGLKSLAAEQLGTVGGGNHYVDLFVDEEDRIWVGVHFGSRGLGYRTATYFLRAAGGKEGMHVPPTVVEDKSDLGADYLKGMQLAGRYAYAGREIVARHVARGILRANILEEVHLQFFNSGPFATLARDWLLQRYGWVDSVVRFAGEAPLVGLVRAIERADHPDVDETAVAQREPGLWEVKIRVAGQERLEPRLAFAVAPDPRESDTRRLEPSELTAWFGGADHATIEGEARAARGAEVPLWSILLVLGVAAFFLEGILLA